MTASAKHQSLAGRLARRALDAAGGPLPEAVAAKARTCLIDFMSCAFEARDLPWSRQALAVTKATGTGAHVVGFDHIAWPRDAAFVNATLGHGLVREDMHAGSISHHGVVVWPVLLALAQRRPVSGGDLLRAAVIGYEAGCRIGRALFDADLARLFRPTGLTAPLGASLAAARLLDFDAEQAISALSLAANTVGGLNQWPHHGGSEMYFQPAFAARNTVTAVELAEAGAFASPDILEGEAGLFAAFARRLPPDGIELFADGHFEILDVYNKPVPACNFAQTPCQAAVAALQEASAGSEAVRSVSIRVTRAALRYPGCDFAGPYERPLQAKMSIQFGVAAALARGTIEEANYARLADAEIMRLVSVTRLSEDAALTAAFPAAQGAEVVLGLADGRRIARRLEDVVHATADDVRRRFREAAGAVLGERRAREIEAFVDDLDAIADAGRLLVLCAPRGEAKRRAEPLSAAE